jgi:diguanylate cyclase (GGDEF)-like protein
LEKPNIPQDEATRLKTLRSLNILDTLPEERFDRLTRVAMRLFGVPIALVSLIDADRQWFKSSVGLGASETPRDISFCGHTILGNDVFIIPDATKDKRFADNPLVMNDPNIRFYAGYPLKAQNGSKLGTLCIIDQKARELNEDDLEAFQDLASMVEQELLSVQTATLDELTKISNRRGFMMLAEHCLKVCTRHQIPASLIYIDLDKFKMINDKFGHTEGDRALVAFTEQVKSTFRESDTFARLGGDEFAILLTQTTKDVAENILARFKESLDKHNQESDCGYDLLFSYGIVEFNPEQHDTVEALLKEGDLLMYDCKRQKPRHNRR